MDPVVIPEDLSPLDAGGIIALSDQVRARLRELAATPTNKLTRSIVDEMTSLRSELDRINTRAVEIDDERAALEAAAAAALEGIDEPDELAAETVELAEDADESAEPTADPETVELAAEVEVVEEETPAVPVGTPISQRDALSALKARQAGTAAGRATVPAPVTPAPSQFGVVAAQAMSLPQGRFIDAGTPFEDVEGLAEVICALQARNNRTSMTGRQFQYVGHCDLFAGTDLALVADDPVSNYAILNRAADPQAATEHLKSLVASGAVCPPDNPIYNFIRYAVPQAPVEAALPTVPAPRGGLRYITSPDFRAARAAIGTRTMTENANPDTPDKPCSRAVCPPIHEAYVTAVSECVRWDNLTYRAFPELVANYMSDVAVNFASVKECLYLTAIDSASTNVTADVPTYGAMRALTFQLRVAASAYRKRQNMPRNATLVWYAPNWLPDVLLADMVNDHALGLDMLTRGSEALISQVFSSLNISPVFYNDQASCSSSSMQLDLQAWRYPQGAGDINLWPHEPVTYLHAPGEFVRMDAGSLDVGLVRDSTLNGTNDLELFLEQWTGVVHLGLEAIKITHTICPNGTAPDAVAELACVGFAS